MSSSHGSGFRVTMTATTGGYCASCSSTGSSSTGSSTGPPGLGGSSPGVAGTGASGGSSALIRADSVPSAPRGPGHGAGVVARGQYARPMITALAGGVGAARFLRGLVQVVDPAEVTVVVNTGDDDWFHGLYVCPDLDSVTYTLAGAQNTETG